MDFHAPRFAKATAADYSSSASESEDEYHAPQLDANDDDFGEFKPRKRRRLRAGGKEKAALGIFGSDSEDDRPGTKWKTKTLRDKGVSFVTTKDTLKSSDEDDEATSQPAFGQLRDDDDDDDPDDAEDEDNDDRGIDLGFGSSGRNFGEQTGKPSHKTETRSNISRPLPKTKFDGRMPLGTGFVPSSAGEPVLNDSSSTNAAPIRNTPQVSAFGKKGKINQNSFGARMLAKMGHVQGQGLGKEGQGRHVIVEANLRPQGVGLGSVKEKHEQERQEEKRLAQMRGEVIEDSDEEENKRKRKKAAKKTLGSAFDSASGTPRRPKTKFLTAEELKSTAPGLHIPAAFTPILDMTGPGGKMLTSTSGIMTPASETSEPTEVAEARKFVKRAQADLLAFSEEWRSLEERKSWLDLELKEKEQSLEDLESDLARLQSISALLVQGLGHDSDWSEVIGCLKQAAQIGPSSPEITDIAVAAIHPFLRRSDWNPLTEPEKFASDLKDISGLLLTPTNNAKAVGKWDYSANHGEDVFRTHQKSTTSYESMMYKNWLPQILSAVRSWDPQDPGPMIAVMDAWSDILPPFVQAQVMENIARKLDGAVSEWNPKRKRQSHNLPHTWLFPWLQYLPPYHLDPRGTGLVADVRRKFRQLIDVWEFERGPVPGLSEWKEILGDQWRPLVMSHVLPSMGKYLRANFRVDPADQEPYLPILQGVLRWRPILGMTTITEVLVQNVMPQWNNKLVEWLALDEADLIEVAEWYQWWRGTLLQDFAAKPSLGTELDKGLRTMNAI